MGKTKTNILSNRELAVGMKMAAGFQLPDLLKTGFLSELYPDTALSKNTVSVFLNDLGKACSRITEFMKCRAASINMDHHLLIDGTLKSNDSKVSSLSNLSRKAKTKGTRDISVLYAFGLELMEPICSKCFPGNMLDVTSYEAFIAENGIMSLLCRAKKVRINDRWQLIKSSPVQMDLLQVLKLILTSEMPKKHRDRPPQKRV